MVSCGRGSTSFLIIQALRLVTGHKNEVLGHFRWAPGGLDSWTILQVFVMCSVYMRANLYYYTRFTLMISLLEDAEWCPLTFCLFCSAVYLKLHKLIVGWIFNLCHQTTHWMCASAEEIWNLIWFIPWLLKMNNY